MKLMSACRAVPEIAYVSLLLIFLWPNGSVTQYSTNFPLCKDNEIQPYLKRDTKALYN